MNITFQYLGNLSEMTGSPSESVELSGSLKEMVDKVRHLHPEISERSFIVSLNGVITHMDSPVEEGDTIALIPPAPGG